MAKVTQITEKIGIGTTHLVFFSFVFAIVQVEGVGRLGFLD